MSSLELKSSSPRNLRSNSAILASLVEILAVRSLMRASWTLVLSYKSASSSSCSCLRCIIVRMYSINGSNHAGVVPAITCAILFPSARELL